MKYRVLILFLILIIPFLTGMKCVPASHKDDVVDPDSICGIWELRKEGPRFIQKGTFSWGENVFSTTSLMIDLNSEDRGGPYIGFDHNIFFVQGKKALGKKVVLTGYYNPEPNEIREVIVTVIDKNTISIELAGENSGWWLDDFYLYPENPDKYFYRVPVDTPIEEIPLDW